MTDRHESLARLHEQLGYKPLSRTWAKVEILLGLAAAAIGMLLGVSAVTRPDVEWGQAAASVALMALGGYLALAGNRSHLYQSNNELIAYVIDEIQRSKV